MSEEYEFLGYGIKGYRSFSEEIASIGPFKKVHLLTGQNNSGKSALADVSMRVLSKINLIGNIDSNSEVFSKSDYPQKKNDYPRSPIVFSLCFAKQALLAQEIVTGLHPPLRKQLEELLALPEISKGDDEACWFDFEMPTSTIAFNSSRELKLSQEQFDSANFDNNYSQLSTSLICQSSGDPVSNIDHIAHKLIPWTSIPIVTKVEAIRKTTSSSDPTDQQINNGEGLINKLLHLSNPKPEAQYINRQKWGNFLAFVRDVLNDEDANVRIDADASMIQVQTGGTDYLALSDLGTGIEELVILAATVACNENKLILIEEPEIHLHPSLQGKIISNLLKDNNGNRFLITTHSPTIINSENVSITHVTKKDGVSYSRTINTVPDIRDTLDDIGAQPADLLQANYVIWVEGPSDRIYVNHWLSKVAPDLRENIDYTIMMYGGRLLNSCSADWEEQGELISLFRINTHFCALMDSDRPGPRKKINSTKSRIIKECEKTGCLSWVTDGRTIENYIPSEYLAEAIHNLYPGKKYRHKLDDKYTCPLDFTFTGVKTRPDKIKIARQIVEQDFMPEGQLLKQVEKLANDIRKSKNN